MSFFDRFKSGGGGSTLSLVMDFISNPEKLKKTLMTQLYPALEKMLVKYIDDVELQGREAQAAILLYKNKETGELDYTLAAIDVDDSVSRQIETKNVHKTLDRMVSKLKLV